ncbi:hypothetical protein ACFP3U_26625 [Kitasatospora misakiensis]|uniref:Uncharacterized protein n=1 Tax=Kitasatospora misakiensis TaxID=67330 RepID=A0ABW0X9Q4_9ACTN
MTLPGFSAEASLDRAVGCYRTSAARLPGHPTSRVFPSGRAGRGGFPPPPWNNLFQRCQAHQQECHVNALLCQLANPTPGFPSFCDLELWSCLAADPLCPPYWISAR